MANLTETSTYDAGVYQLETTDPVTGGSSGVANSPHKNLANRTNYLKAHVDALETTAAGLAPIASPTFTGNPTAPTPALGDNDTSIATTAFVQGTLGGYLSKSVAGGSNVTLTAVEAGNGIIVFTGVLTANINVIFPGSPTRSWILINNTTGSYTITAKLSSGVGVVIQQGYTLPVLTDGSSVMLTKTDPTGLALGLGYMQVRDEKSSGTAGGSSVVGAQTRTLNTVSANTISGASLASNQITLPAGTYRIRALAPSVNVNMSRAYIYNVTDAVNLILGCSNNGTNTSNGDAVTSFCEVSGRFTLAAQKVIELRMYCSEVSATSGLGTAISQGTEVYSTVEIIKES